MIARDRSGISLTPRVFVDPAVSCRVWWTLVYALAKRYGFSYRLSSPSFRKGLSKCIANPVAWIFIISVLLRENFQRC